MSKMPEYLPQEVVGIICAFIRENTGDFYNENVPLGRGIFQIIERHCIVMYYPIMDIEEQNDGFLLTGIPLSNVL